MDYLGLGGIGSAGDICSTYTQYGQVCYDPLLAVVRDNSDMVASVHQAGRKSCAYCRDILVECLIQVGMENPFAVLYLKCSPLWVLKTDFFHTLGNCHKARLS